MQASSTPESDLSSAARRRRSGVRARTVSLTVLAAAALLYCAVYCVMRNIDRRRRAAEITRSLKEHDLQRAAALLKQCRSQAPDLAKQPRFAQWQRDLQQLQEHKQQRQKTFQKKLRQLKIFLSAGQLPPGAPVELQLAEIARYASTREELEELRSLQQHCESLARINALKSAAQSVKKLHSLHRKIRELARLRQQNLWQQYNQNAGLCQKILNDESLAIGSLPEIAAQRAQLQHQLTGELDAGKAAEQIFQAQKHAFEALLKNPLPDEFQKQCQDFLQQYPGSIYTANIRSLLRELAVLTQDRTQEIQKKLNSMDSLLLQAQQCWQTELRRIVESELTETRFELTLQQNNSFIRFETREKCTFLPPDADGIIRIEIPCIDGRKLLGRFRADGHGELRSSRERWQGKLVNCHPAGSLPIRYVQELLLQLETELPSRAGTGEFAEYMQQVCKNIQRSKFLLPPSTWQKLQTALKNCENKLNYSWQEYISLHRRLTLQQKNLPVFAGVVQIHKNCRIKCFSDAMPDNGKVFLIDSSNQKNPFQLLGIRQNKKWLRINKAVPCDGKFRIAVAVLH